ncbi:hypothetical protein [Paenibacillus lupini]|uniref:hypothetical protein n=1 Tax=Paenibacillus lupini TaxID=1450204 RepID=UPI001422E4DB|nr:hypothetical protein [Paenibacillus lupini]NIK22033.1 hypothetical protein [Paenibacillus lupini]
MSGSARKLERTPEVAGQPELAFIAAMIGAAFTETDNERIIAIGLGQIPSTCRLAADIQQAVDIARSVKDRLKLVDEIWRTFNHYPSRPYE